MGSITEDMMSILEGDTDVLAHYGIPRRSGRYPWGSGEDPYQHSRDFLGRVEELRKQGFTYTDEKGNKYTGDTAIAKSMGLSTTQFRTELGLAKDERRALDVARAKSLKEDGLGATEIGKKMGLPESTVRSLLNADSEARMLQAKNTAEFLKKQIEEKGMIDVGGEVNRELNISPEKMQQALYLLEREGYPVYGGRIDQVTNPGKKTTVKVLCPPGTEHSEIYEAFKEGKVSSLMEYTSHDGGETFDKFVYPKSLDSKRLMIRYKEDGGIDKDGIVELRRGVADLDLGESKYSQVRILVDGDRYIKGMAVYSDNMPDGYDIVFNTNKSKDVPMRDVLKKIKNDPDNPFGSLIKPKGQSYYIDADGNKQLSLINKTREEGDWTEWADALPSQFLSKQSVTLARKQLNLAVADKQNEFDSICSLTNPTVKKYYLQKFADECDASAVNLKAAALPGQKYHVIIPINSLKDNEVYAPGYESGTQLALIRYPHGGTFEIPILTVNNKNKNGRTIIGTDSIDAVGINKKIADRLSGADFDGDTVMCIPTHDKAGKVKIKSTNELEGLKGFDPKDSYGYDTKTVDSDGKEHYYRNGKEFRIMKNTGTQMGVISNLITDMTLAGAYPDELAAAVRHSMVVIDAEKHHLDYKQSEIDNNVSALHKKYQGKATGGAATIISKAKGQKSVPKRQGSPIIDPETGKVSYKIADDAYYEVSKVDKRTGEVKTITKTRLQKSTKMAEADDAYELVSPARHKMELVYADYANTMKSMANQARKEMMSTGKVAYSATANKTYKAEVDSLKSKLNDALLNAPRERAAQLKANAEVERKIRSVMDENPGMSRKEAAKTIDPKKTGQQALSRYRTEVGSISRKDRSIKITDSEWAAIQAGAVSENILTKILNNTDPDSLRQRAMPKASSSLSTAQVNTIKAMRASNYTLAEIANKMGVPTSTVSNYLKGEN